ncbi:uncharacterized protein LOC120649208 [Panicum virgatum]|uniref:uncharacterized protein LOC120649208 n=1 Tax=Panicum virgatum TaxID=38727 RepID=UPI0019D5F98B|nr:uncharacterized protein LOC120649208 [Panicum virgatum]
MIVGGIEKDNEMPAAVNMVGEDTHAAMNVVDDMKIRGFEWAAVPQYGETTAGPPMVEEEEKEHFMTVGCDPHGDEPTGVDEEWRYFNNVDSATHNVQPVENIEVEVQKRKRARPIPEFDIECVPDDEAAMVDDYIVPHTIHDKENPVIKEGDTFGDKEEFILTMRTYAIKNEFETRVEHSDKERYMARCGDENCGWRVFAKKLHGGNTFMVVKLSKLADHTCSSSARMKGHQALTTWISKRVKDIIKEDPTLGARK